MTGLTKGAWAQAVCNREFICVETYSGYGSGARADPKGKRNFLTPSDENEAVEEAVLDALAASRCLVLGAPRPGVELDPEVEFDMELYDYKLTAERYAAWIGELMERHGYKTKRALFKDMKTCRIAREGQSITFRPTQHVKLEVWAGSREEGFEDVVVPANSTPAEGGAAMRVAFSRSTAAETTFDGNNRTESDGTTDSCGGRGQAARNLPLGRRNENAG
jgi:hypothetical protein